MSEAGDGSTVQNNRERDCPRCGTSLSPSMDPDGGWVCLNDLCPQSDELFESDLQTAAETRDAPTTPETADRGDVTVERVDPTTVRVTVEETTVLLEAADAVQVAERLREAAVGDD